ncbi:MAG: hypothetical protein E7473_11900 [Ruminococcaceae bacterium]|nr:hypothetical protein [Oscillospiraceae bacterium]
MKEAEVSIRVALYFIRNNITNENVRISIDGAHIKTNDTIHFDILNFLKENGCKKIDENDMRWQGSYEVMGYKSKMEISSQPGIGDVRIILPTGFILHIESKKGSNKKGNTEYSLMREAIGQLMTTEYESEKIIPTVAVPYSPKSYELAKRWINYKKIQDTNIHFILVQENGEIINI